MMFHDEIPFSIVEAQGFGSPRCCQANGAATSRLESLCFVGGRSQHFLAFDVAREKFDCGIGAPDRPVASATLEDADFSAAGGVVRDGLDVGIARISLREIQFAAHFKGHDLWIGRW